eukprot:GHVQ01032037.1.p1 GENE.GHVQ01032037.1~~GHVQ01032037.1.p1  ORF type:complete len:710 (-),score=83.68 GHVQ01032037.1:310-2439(-)
MMDNQWMRIRYRYKGESNLSGSRPDLSQTENIAKRQHSDNVEWFVLIDCSKLAGSVSIDVSHLQHAHFLVFSFYKLFGFPTGLGLVVRHDALHCMLSSSSSSLRGTASYFGGGTVAAASAVSEVVQLHQTGLHNQLELGTPNFTAILSLPIAMNRSTGPFSRRQLECHVDSVRAYAWKRLEALQHRNGQRLVRLYGEGSPRRGYDYVLQGPVIIFSVIMADGSVVDYDKVVKMCWDNNVIVRGGCHCNVGGCEKYLGLTESDVRWNYYQVGKRCGQGEIKSREEDGERKVTGCVRASFGYTSIQSDVDRFCNFLMEWFLDKVSVVDRFDGKNSYVSNHVSSGVCVVRDVMIYPVKGCRAVRLSNWLIDSKSMTFLWDRYFRFVTSSVHLCFLTPLTCFLHNFVKTKLLTLKCCPNLSLVQPHIVVSYLNFISNCPVTPPLLILSALYASAPPLSVPICSQQSWAELLSNNFYAFSQAMLPPSLLNTSLKFSQQLKDYALQQFSLLQAALKSTSDSSEQHIWIVPPCVDLLCQHSVTDWCSSVLLRPAYLESSAFSPSPFMNAAPFLLISKETMRCVERLLGKSPGTLDPRRFRPNFIVDGLPAFEEMRWKACTELSSTHQLPTEYAPKVFIVKSLCVRCTAINVCLGTGSIDSSLLCAVNSVCASVLAQSSSSSGSQASDLGFYLSICSQSTFQRRFCLFRSGSTLRIG